MTSNALFLGGQRVRDPGKKWEGGTWRKAKRAADEREGDRNGDRRQGTGIKRINLLTN